MTVLVGILTVSDRCSKGEAEDRSGPALKKRVEAEGWSCSAYQIVPDDAVEIQKFLRLWCDEKKIPLILTTGGTGLSPRDVTPESTRGLLEKELAGISEMMRHEGLKHTPFASLSRGLAGTRKQSLILNLPGSPNGAVESLEAAIPVIPHALETLGGASHEGGAHETSGCHAAHHHDAREAHLHGAPALLPVSEALARMMTAVAPLPPIEMKLVESVGCVLAEDMEAREDLPPFENSAMDGYAVRAGDLLGAGKASPRELSVLERIPAGALPGRTLQAGEAARIMTGAPLPQGADAVVMQELTEKNGDGRVKVLQEVKPGENVRQKGEDVRKGDRLLKAGTRLRPYEIALLASQGFAFVRVVRKPRVTVLATGDELLDISSPPAPGKIRNSNGPALVSALKRWGIEPIDLGIAPDAPERLKAIFKEALDKSDALVISGGVSVGELDYTRELLFKLGVKEVLWRVAVRPGKPFFFGIYQERTPVFGLPGNPISSLVCLEELARPVLEKMRGVCDAHPGYHLFGKALNDFFKPEERQQYLFCVALREGDGFGLKIIRPQGSHMMGMASKANALAVAPEGVARIKEGDILPFRWLK